MNLEDIIKDLDGNEDKKWQEAEINRLIYEFYTQFVYLCLIRIFAITPGSYPHPPCKPLIMVYTGKVE